MKPAALHGVKVKSVHWGTCFTGIMPHNIGPFRESTLEAFATEDPCIQLGQKIPTQWALLFQIFRPSEEFYNNCPLDTEIMS